MRNCNCWLIASIVIALLLIAVWAWATETAPEEWREYQDPVADIRVSYPQGRDAIVAVERPDSLAAWSVVVLETGENHKITLLQRGDVFWPGQYQIRVLSNPDSLDLENFYSRFDLSDLWENSAGDPTIAGRPAKTWIRWAYDSLVREYLFVNSAGVVHAPHDYENGNDPDFEEHRRIYREITRTLGPVPRSGHPPR